MALQYLLFPEESTIPWRKSNRSASTDHAIGRSRRIKRFNCILLETCANSEQNMILVVGCPDCCCYKHVKQSIHLTKRAVNEEGIETEIEELYFFYDLQSRPAFLEYNGIKYRYVHNLQGDVVTCSFVNDVRPKRENV